MRWTAAILALSVAACGGTAPRGTPGPRPTATPSPTLCSGVRSRVVGHVTTPAATELSGLAPTPDGILWSHNDSGDAPRLFALDTRGRLLGQTAVQGATAVDWEDIAARGRTLYVGDIGDNAAARPDIVVYRLREPRPDAAATATAIHLRYPDGPHDAEALLVDRGTFTIVTKTFGGVAGIYTGRSGTLRHAGNLSMALVTAGDLSGDGRTIVLRSYLAARLWPRRRGESIAHALRGRPCDIPADLLAEGQGEALALTRDGRAFYTVPEGPKPALRLYTARR